LPSQVDAPAAQAAALACRQQGGQSSGENAQAHPNESDAKRRDLPTLWAIGWTLLSTFNERRAILETFDDPGRVSGSPFLAVAAMYLVVPSVMFLVVHLAAAAAALPFSPAVPPPAGPGLGPLAPAASAAVRLAR